MKLRKINESFVCKNCKKKVEVAIKTCRNHCPFCLYSLHVDQHVPGDRMSDCNGLMKPINIIHNSKKGHQIEFICTKCGKRHVNMVAQDDNIDEIVKVMKIIKE